MNGGQPDWAYVARSLVKVVLVTAALFLALSGTDRVLRLFIDPYGERMAHVYGTAARIANPDKRLTHGYHESGGLLEPTYELWGEPRQAGPGVGRRQYEITRNVFGSARPSTRSPRCSSPFAVVTFTRPMTSRQLVALNRRHQSCGGEDVLYVYRPSSTTNLLLSRGSHG